MNKKTLIGKSASLISSIILLAFSQQANALPGTTSNSPLFLTTFVEPNLFWILDDSGSMEWEPSAATDADSSGLPTLGGWSANYYVLPTREN
mgnify:CR=1 FL=1